MRRYLHIAAFIILISAGGLGCSKGLSDKVRTYRLDNGMTWLLLKRPSAPVFSGIVMVRVGGADEEMGKTGLAHMFEHMAFKGSSRIGTKNFEMERAILDEIEKLGEKMEAREDRAEPSDEDVAKLSEKIKELEKKADAFRKKSEIWEIMKRNGARGLNAYTAKDVTAYFSSMPANRLELWTNVMAEMIFDPVYRKFYTERAVVVDERRSLTENDPNRDMGEKLLETAFKDGPYHWSTIGYMEDIEDLTIADAKRFHAKHYVPANMVGVLVGDIDIGDTKRILRDVFGKFEKKPIPPSPPSAGEHGGDVVKKFNFDAEPSLAIAYHKPTLPDPSEYVFDVITSLLCDGRSSRLKKRLVYDKRMVQELYCSDGYPGSRLDNLFLIWIDPMNGHSLQSILDEVMDELNRLKTEPIGKDELNRVRKQVKSGFLFVLDDNMGLAQAMARFATIFGDWTLLDTYPKYIEKVGPNDVMRIAKKYLVNKNRVVVERHKGKR